MPDITAPDIASRVGTQISEIGNKFRESLTRRVDVRTLQPGTSIHIAFEPDVDGKPTPPYALKVFYPTSDGSSVNVFCTEENLNGQLGYVVGARPLGADSTLVVPDQIAIGQSVELKVNDPEVEKMQRAGIEKIIIGDKGYTYDQLVAYVIKNAEARGEEIDEEGASTYLRNMRLIGVRTILTPPVKNLMITRPDRPDSSLTGRIRKFLTGDNREDDRRHLGHELVANMEATISKKQVMVTELPSGSTILVKCADLENPENTEEYEILVEDIILEGGDVPVANVRVTCEAEELYGYTGRIVGTAVGLGSSVIPGAITVGSPVELRVNDPEVLKIQRMSNEPTTFLGHEYPNYRSFVEAFQAADLWGSRQMSFEQVEALMIEKGYLGTKIITTLPVTDFEVGGKNSQAADNG